MTKKKFKNRKILVKTSSGGEFGWDQFIVERINYPTGIPATVLGLIADGDTYEISVKKVKKSVKK